MEQTRVALVVPHELPAERATVLDDLGIVVAHLGVERDGPADAVTGHHLHQAEDPDTVTVVARRPVDDVGRQAGAAGHRLVQRKGLDVRDDPEREARAVRPGDPGSAIDRNIGKRPGALWLHVTSGAPEGTPRREANDTSSGSALGRLSPARGQLGWLAPGRALPAAVELPGLPAQRDMNQRTLDQVNELPGLR